MANILLRSPRYEGITVSTGKASVKLEASFAGSLRYTLVKNATAGSVVTFEIAELALDYLSITYAGSYSAQTLAISLTFKEYTGQNATGTESTNSTITHTGFDGYGFYMQGANPTVPNTQWLIPQKESDNTYEVFLPDSTAGVVPYMSDGGAFSYVSIGASDTSIAANSGSVPGSNNPALTITRRGCISYRYTPKKLTFVNRFGALQDLYFYLKEVLTTNTARESFNSNTISLNGSSTTYSVNAPTKKLFDRTASQKVSLSSGYYPEFATQYFEDLLLSNQIFMTQPDPLDISSTQIVPVIATTSEIIRKTSLNDKLINYVIDFDFAFDYINNVR